MPTKAEYARKREYYLTYARDYAAVRRRPRPTVQERLWAKVDKTDTCWLWTGSLGAGGRYGSIRANGKMRIVHRLTYEWAHGPVPNGLELDHLCREPRCVRPDHLKPVTHQENVRRGAWGRRALVCVRGHGAKTQTTSGWVCRECAKQRNRDYRRRLAGAA